MDLAFLEKVQIQKLGIFIIHNISSNLHIIMDTPAKVNSRTRSAYSERLAVIV